MSLHVGLRHDARRLGISFSRARDNLAFPNFCTGYHLPAAWERARSWIATVFSRKKGRWLVNTTLGSWRTRSGTIFVTVTWTSMRLALVGEAGPGDITFVEDEKPPISLRIAVLRLWWCPRHLQQQPVWDPCRGPARSICHDVVISTATPSHLPMHRSARVDSREGNYRRVAEHLSVSAVGEGQPSRKRCRIHRAPWWPSLPAR